MVQTRRIDSKNSQSAPQTEELQPERKQDGSPKPAGSPVEKHRKAASLHLVSSARSSLHHVAPHGGPPEIEQTPSERHLIIERTREQDAFSVEEIERLNELQRYKTAENTRKNYRSQWRKFERWCRRKGLGALPAKPGVVATYLAGLSNGLSDGKKRKPATLQLAAAAISYFHKERNGGNPVDSDLVRTTLSGAWREAGRMQKQARGLTAEHLEAIKRTACLPRRGRGGHLETEDTAKRRGEVDIAIISLMRDCLLRLSEAAEAKWSDVSNRDDGTGRLLIRRSKTDQEGASTVVFISRTTMEALRSIRNGASDDDSIFRLGKNQIANRIKKAAHSAGLEDGFSGHSLRVGMARDLARDGAELPSLMVAGRWRSPMMPAQYIRNEEASKGPVARYHSTRGS